MKTIITAVVIIIACSGLLAQDSYRMFINKIDMPMNREGVLADVLFEGRDGGRIDSIVFLFSGGFFLAGKNQDVLWANAVASASRLQDYLPGNVDSSASNPLYKIYIVRRSDEPFSASWQEWSNAVSIGAEYYDGNGDGIYSPVDLNSNGIWDITEDSPPLIGNEIAFCVYNDGVDPSLRRFSDVQPQGIEVRQTVFAFDKNYSNVPLEALDYTIFVRYSLVNTGKVAEIFDSVYFGIWADTDLGTYFDDLAGCDLSAQSGYIYNPGSDQDFGINPPAHFLTSLQSPYAFIPGISFIDNNVNGEYNEGIDIPLDTAYNFKGSILGVQTIPGAKNIGMTAFTHYMKSDIIIGDPNFKNEMYNYLRGLDRLGQLLDPCSWQIGTVVGGAVCNEINPLFWYSGDPVSNYGWLNIFPTDQRQLVSSGPFKLEVNKPVDIIAGYIVGRGTDELNSITVAKEYAKTMVNFVKSNFSDFTVTDVNNQKPIAPENFYLFHNYPNPFNPSTVIRYQIPEAGLVSLKVYDLLGREVASLVDEIKPAGSYEVKFDASELSSGVYFYRLQSGDFISARKLILIK